LERKPKDTSYDAELKALRRERTALSAVIQDINRKDVFNFLSDEGLLPNYAFPEAGIVLRALLYRRDAEVEDSDEEGRSELNTYEYIRPASAAMSEFAPENTFYAGGRRVTVDQVDRFTARSERWRLCPNCSHAERDEIGRHVAACPRCGSVGWGDAGQVRAMLKVRMVYATDDYGGSLI